MNDNNDEEEPSADANGGMSYIDRLVHELDNDSSDDEGNINPDTAIVDGNDRDSDSGEEDTASDDDDWSYLEEEESSDDELEYDRDEIDKDFVSDMLYNSTKTSPLESKFKSSLSDESKELLLWRLDEDESFSDWTIQVSSITNNEERIKKTYYVHKVTLGLGPKKSDYFEALLLSGQFSESSNSTSVVDLPEDTAKYFDVFLDYMYTHPSECICLINRDNRSALQYLAKYFLVPKLTEDILNFIQQDIQDLKNMEEYLIEFGYEEDTDNEIAKEVLTFAAQVCATKICDIEVGSSLNYTLTPAIMLYMISTVRMKIDLYDSQRYHICRLATSYVKYFHTKLDVNYFLTVTSDLYFPDDISSTGTVAIDILEIIELANWESHVPRDLLRTCTVILCQFLADEDTELSYNKIAKITKKVPKTVMADLLTNALIAKKSHKVESINVSCKLESSIYGQPAGKVVKVDIKTTDSINYVQYLIRRELMGMTKFQPYDIVGERLLLLCEGEALVHGQLVMNTPITSETVLKVYRYFPTDTEKLSNESEDE